MNINPNSINEGIIDKRIRQTVEWSKTSDTHLKYACIAAAQVVGTYSHATKMMAEQCKRSVSTIENYAHAHWLYAELRRGIEHSGFFSIRMIWRKLPASHWWLAYDIQAKGYDALHYLANAYIHSWSGRDMMQEYKKDMEAGNAPMVIKRALIAFRGLGDELLSHMTANRAAAAECLTEFARLYEEDGKL